MIHSHRLIRLALLLLLLPIHAMAQPQYTAADSTRIVSLIAAARKQTTKAARILYLARQLKGVPYVAKTLEHNDKERLVVNLHELDCTTYVESVLAMYLCAQQPKATFQDYCRHLQSIRYLDGNVAYQSRLHYFSSWIDENTRQGRVSEITSPNPPFSRTQTPTINYMTTHSELYPMLVKNPGWIADIAKMERSLAGKRYRYIPKTAISNTSLLRRTIKDGDILAIVTKKKGLDTSHIGIAVWHKDGLHLLNASMIHKKVVEEPMTLRQYMQQHSTQIGIRVIRVVK